MHNSMLQAQKTAESVRYSGDNLRHKNEIFDSKTDSIRCVFSQNGLRISKEVTPSLFNQLLSVLNNLSIPTSSIDAFIYASPDIQAECYSGNTSECVIRFSSSLIEILSEDEFSFVVGHELGHFLLGHSIANIESGQDSLEFFIQQRSQEISADRFGLIACGSLDTAIKALMKTVSGLSSKHLRFDVGTFISQLSKPTSLGLTTSSHPSILLRSRALLWFSLNEVFAKGCNDYNTSNNASKIAKVDAQIQKDMDKYVDGAARELIEQAKSDLAMWMAASDIVNDGKFDFNEQRKFAEIFGDDLLGKLKGFLKELPLSEIQTAVHERLVAARNNLEKLIPSSYESEYLKINKWN